VQTSNFTDLAKGGTEKKGKNVYWAPHGEKPVKRESLTKSLREKNLAKVAPLFECHTLARKKKNGGRKGTLSHEG